MYRGYFVILILNVFKYYEKLIFLDFQFFLLIQ